MNTPRAKRHTGKLSGTHWAQLSEAGALTGMRFMIFAYRLGGRPLFRICLFPVIVYFFIFRAQARRASTSYLRILRTAGAISSDSWIGLQSFAHFWSFANALIDKFAVWMGNITMQDIDVIGYDLPDRMLAEGEGGVLLMSHLGNFEICRCLSTRNPKLKLTVLMHTHHAEKFNHLLNKQIGANNIEILQVTEITPATAMVLSERIERGEFIAIAGDRIAVNHPENSVSVDFLGERAPLPTGPFTLATILQARLISVFCLRDHTGYKVIFEQLSAPLKVPRNVRQAHIQSQAQTYATQLEVHCRQYPLQWFNFFDFWLPPRITPMDNENSKL